MLFGAYIQISPFDYARTLRNKKICRESDLQVGDWLVVDFSAGKKTEAETVSLNHEMISCLKASSCETAAALTESVFSFPANEDRCTSDFNSIKGTVDPSVPMRRGAWQFVGVNAKQC